MYRQREWYASKDRERVGEHKDREHQGPKYIEACRSLDVYFECNGKLGEVLRGGKGSVVI